MDRALFLAAWPSWLAASAFTGLSRRGAALRAATRHRLAHGAGALSSPIRDDGQAAPGAPVQASRQLRSEVFGRQRLMRVSNLAAAPEFARPYCEIDGTVELDPMKVIQLSEYPGTTIDAYGSSEAKYTRLGQGDGAVGFMRVGPGGRVGKHRAGLPQLMVILAGRGFARANGEPISPIGPGLGVIWREGEEHETWTNEGMDVLIIEAADAELGLPHPPPGV